MIAGRLVLVAAIALFLGLGVYWLAEQRPAARRELGPWAVPVTPESQLITDTPSPEEDEDVLNADDYLGEALEDLRAVE